MNGETIIRIAKSYVGFEETPKNSGFKNKDFEHRMRQVGWIKGHAWCSYFGELVWKEAYAKYPELIQRFSECFHGSSTATYRNFETNKLFKTGKTFQPGALMIFRYGVDWRGHLCIAIQEHTKNIIQTIDGNTNDAGGREGYIVAEKRRPIVAPFKKNGLNFVGFVYPPLIT